MTLTVEGAAIMMDAMTEGDGSYVDNLGKAAPQSTTIGILSFAKGITLELIKTLIKLLKN